MGGEAARFAFVIGTGRCGSSLLHEVLARHREVGFLSNLEDRLPLPPGAGRWNGPLYRQVPQSLTRKGRLRYAPSEGYRALSREVSPVVSAPFRDMTAADLNPWLESRFRSFFASRAAAQGTPVFLHKFTGWSRVGFIGAVFPEARFIHVVRDGRAVASSLLQTGWWRGFAGPPAWGWGPLPEEYATEWEASGRSFVLLAGLQWKMLIDAATEAAAPLPAERWKQLRYEDFIADPADHLEEACEFLGLEWDADFARQVGRTTFRRERADAYRRDLSTEQVRLLEDSLRSHLARLGYSCSDP